MQGLNNCKICGGILNRSYYPNCFICSNDDCFITINDEKIELMYYLFLNEDLSFNYEDYNFCFKNNFSFGIYQLNENFSFDCHVLDKAKHIYYNNFDAFFKTTDLILFNKTKQEIVDLVKRIMKTFFKLEKMKYLG